MKLAVLGGGTGMSTLLTGLKKMPFDISAIVTVADDGKSTGRLRKEFNTVAVGDIRRILASLSQDDEEIAKLFNYRFNTSSDLDGHPLGNLLLTGASQLTGNMSDAIELLNSMLRLQGNVLPLTEDNVTLMGRMEDGAIVKGEAEITKDKRLITDVFYEKKPEVNPHVLKAIKEADAIILSMGSVFTSIIPNLICPEVIREIDKSKAKIIYVCNIMTQPGETDDFSVSHHIKLLNKYLGKRKIDAVVLNTGVISPEIVQKYSNKEDKDLVPIDYKNLEKLKVDLIEGDYVIIDKNRIRHNSLRVAINILSYLMD